MNTLAKRMKGNEKRKEKKKSSEVLREEIYDKGTDIMVDGSGGQL